MPRPHVRPLCRFTRALAYVSAACLPSHALAFGPPETPTLSAYGGTGLLDMRNARFMSDGYLAATVSIKEPDDRIALTFQAFPWAEVIFRYSINDALDFGTGALYDRSFDLKLKLSEETEYMPQFALGFQDVLGTGFYSGEYLVASKAVGPFDVTLGVGWGRLASRGTLTNPFVALSDRARNRDIEAGAGGTPTFAYFRGPDMGVFGGIEYQTPINGLRIQAEYSSDSYGAETRMSGVDYDFPVNVGISYRAWSWLDVGLSYMHGREVGIRVSAYVDPGAENWPVRLDRPPRFRARDDEVVNALARRNAALDPVTGTRFVDLTQDNGSSPLPTTPDAPASQADGLTITLPGQQPQRLTPETAALAIRQGLEAQALTVAGIEVSADAVKLAIENARYRRDAEAIARAARVLTNFAPDSVERFEITTMRQGQPLTTATLPRAQLETIARRQGGPEELWQASTLRPAPVFPPVLNADLYPRFEANLYPSLRYSLFDPENPFYFQVGIGGAAGVQPFRGFTIEGSAFASLFDNLASTPRLSDSVLPHVRSDAATYLHEGRYSLARLTASYHFKLSPEIYGRMSGGYLEWMFGGVGGELLYRPFGQRWSVGVDLWAVRQRDFNQRFGFRNYETITGHFSVYYDVPWYDVQLAVHAGRYLAGDYGATFEAMRTFRTGVKVGAWFTLTNVPFERFGEGSFDKGIRIVFPLEWIAPFGSQSEQEIAIRPVQRDGGQMLIGNKQLFPMTESSGYGALSRDWAPVFRP